MFGNCTTDTFGEPVHSDSELLTAGTQTPVLLLDHYSIKKLAQFNRERAPGQFVHACGSDTHREFVVTNPHHRRGHRRRAIPSGFVY